MITTEGTSRWRRRISDQASSSTAMMCEPVGARLNPVDVFTSTGLVRGQRGGGGLVDVGPDVQAGSAVQGLDGFQSPERDAGVRERLGEVQLGAQRRGPRADRVDLGFVVIADAGQLCLDP